MILEPLSLTESGRPVLLPGEVEHTLLNKVKLVDYHIVGKGGVSGIVSATYFGCQLACAKTYHGQAFSPVR